MRSLLPLVTPEEVVVHFRIGDLGGRAWALFLDILVLGLVSAAVLIPLALTGRLAGELAQALGLVFVFVLRVLYFPFFELRWHGRTPGKKAAGLRVVARDGGPLTAGMVFARGLTREMEIFLPLTLIFAQGRILTQGPAWLGLMSFVWVFALAAIPFTNRQHLRIGDLVAGTVVVADPKPALLDDLAETARRTRASEEYTFTREQLEIYGIHELQILEDVLRRESSPHREELLLKIAATVRHKVDWVPPPGRSEERFQAERFLRSFYAAQRSRLETGLLTGERRERKVG